MAAEENSSGEESCCEKEPEPQAGSGEESEWSKVRHRIHRHCAGSCERVEPSPAQTIQKHRREVLRVEQHFLKHADCEWGQQSPE